MPQKRRPRRGSLQYWPRKRAKRIYPCVKWLKNEKLKPLGFAAYKAGMTSVQYIKDNKMVMKPATILDAPSLFVCGLRYYQNTYDGLRVLGEIWTKIPKELEKKLGKHEMKKNFENGGKVDLIRLIVCTQPTKSGMKKMKPELFEIGLGGNIKEQTDYSKSLLDKEINISDVFRPGDYCDITGITKGHGFTGVIKRFGVKLKGRKAEQKHRHTGSIGPTTPRHIMWQVPLPGQYGFFQRTEYNKRILMIDNKPEKINPKSGLAGYGIVPGSFILVEGSITGPRKRLIMLSHQRRKAKYSPVEIKYIKK